MTGDEFLSIVSQLGTQTMIRWWWWFNFCHTPPVRAIAIQDADDKLRDRLLAQGFVHKPTDWLPGNVSLFTITCEDSIHAKPRANAVSEEPTPQDDAALQTVRGTETAQRVQHADEPALPGVREASGGADGGPGTGAGRQGDSDVVGLVTPE